MSEQPASSQPSQDGSRGRVLPPSQCHVRSFELSEILPRVALATWFFSNATAFCLHACNIPHHVDQLSLCFDDHQRLRQFTIIHLDHFSLPVFQRTFKGSRCSMYTMLRSRRYHDTAHTPGSAINQTAYIDRPTVQQLKVAFQETPIKLREIEQRWKGRRKEQMAIAVGADTKVQTPTLRATTHHENSKMTTNHGRSYLPSPPSTPPEAQLQDREKKSRPTTQPAAVPTSKQPKPILAYPLMPTLQPVRIVSGVYMTIPPKSHAAEYEIKLDMGDKQIVVLAGGRSLSSVSMIAAKMDAKPKVSQINIDEHDNWTESERGQWNLVVDLVERVKRKTPRVGHPVR